MSDAGKSPLAALKRAVPTIKTRGLNDRHPGSLPATDKSRDSDLNPSKEPLPANLPKAVVQPAIVSLAKANFEPFVLSPGPKPDRGPKPVPGCKPVPKPKPVPGPQPGPGPEPSPETKPFPGPKLGSCFYKSNSGECIL